MRTNAIYLACIFIVVIVLKCYGVTYTVGPTGMTGVDFNSIQAAINALDNINPATDSDPNPYHTILVQPGVYNAGDEEAFQTHVVEGSGRGNASAGLTRSLIVVNDVDEDLDGDGYMNRYLDGLRIIGAGTNLTIIDGQKAVNPGRIMFIMNTNVVVRNMTLKGGYFSGGWKPWDGAGILAAGAGCLLEDLRIEDCQLLMSEDDWAGCVSINGNKGVARRLEITKVQGSGGGKGSGIALALGASSAVTGLVDRCYVHGCWGIKAGIGVDIPTPATEIIYGSIVASNNVTVGAFWYSGGGWKTGYMINCTSANNTGRPLALGGWMSWVRVLNCIFSDNGAPIVAGGGDAGYIYFMHNIIDEAGFVFTNKLIDGYSSGSSDDGSNVLPPVDPGFRDQSNYDYRLLQNSPAVDKIPLDGSGNNAFVLTHPAGFVYLDVDKSGSYNPGLDFIIKLRGYSPGDGDWVVTSDRLGNRRLSQFGLDAGCHEYRPPSGTVIYFK